eukprot:scaffold34930_cov70-Phaeocystis_antarctica.AAC.1
MRRATPSFRRCSRGTMPATSARWRVARRVAAASGRRWRWRLSAGMRVTKTVDATATAASAAWPR